jgi:hypothetical protein
MKFKIIAEGYAGTERSFYNQPFDMSGRYNKGEYRAPAYNRKTDYLQSKASEEEVKRFFEANGHKFLEYGRDWKWDIKFENNTNHAIWTTEVKESFESQRTGNVAIEFEKNGRPTSIQQTEAKYWIEKIHEPSGEIIFVMLLTERLKQMIEDKQYHRIAVGGDPGTGSKVYLFKIDVIKRNGHILNIETF